MFPFIINMYDKISQDILDLLFKFSSHIMSIEDTTVKLPENNNFSSNPEFQNFISCFQKGRYYHFRCQGYMECLVFTKYYSPFSLNYWLHELVYPAADNFKKAMVNIEKLKESKNLAENKDFEKLLSQLGNFQKTSMKIMDTIKFYNL